MAEECFDSYELEIPNLLTESDGEFELAEEDNTLTIPAARNRIKDRFATYHRLLNDKESELLAELELLEETRKPELNRVRSDLVRLRGVVSSLNESFGTDSLKPFRESQRQFCETHILHFERSERLLSHVTLQFSENFVENLIKIVPFWSKAEFRTELEPVLKLQPNFGEDWYIVSDEWFSEFTNSINLTNPQQNDSWEFPVMIPIQTDDTNNVKLLHSKAWDVLLGFNGFSPGSIPIKRQTYLNVTTNMIEVPIRSTVHKCTIGHNGGNNKFSFDFVISSFPYETYRHIVNKLSEFSALFTEHTPIIYSFPHSDTVSCNTPDYTKYKVGKPQTQSRSRPYTSLYTSLRPTVLQPIHNLASQVGIGNETLLFIIPDSLGNNLFQVTSN